MKSIANLAVLLSLSACSSVIEGTSQEIMVNTNPADAECSLLRQGNSIASITPTSGSATIKKTKYDITIVCNKEGYQEATYLNHSGAAGATFGNIVLGGGIGWAVDSASGADNKYDSPVNITLVPEQRQASSSGKKHLAMHKKPSEYPGQTNASATDAESTKSDGNEWPSSKH